REKPSALMEDSLLAQPIGANITVVIEQREGVTTLQYKRTVISQRRFREDVELVIDLDYVIHLAPAPRLLHRPKTARVAHIFSCSRRPCGSQRIATQTPCGMFHD